MNETLKDHFNLIVNSAELPAGFRMRPAKP